VQATLWRSYFPSCESQLPCFVMEASKRFRSKRLSPETRRLAKPSKTLFSYTRICEHASPALGGFSMDAVSMMKPPLASDNSDTFHPHVSMTRRMPSRFSCLSSYGFDSSVDLDGSAG